MKKHVLDSFAVLAYLYEEPGADKVKSLLVEALEDKAELFLSTVNWAEVAYISKRKSGEAKWKAASESLLRLPIEIVPADIELANIAAELKARHSISLADAFAGALAKLKKAELLTGDPEFKELQKEISVNWL